MLRIQPIRSPLEARTVLDAFDPRSTTWLVSDLKSKLDLNRRLLATVSFVPGTGILRASELWRMLLTRTRADLQIVSREFALTFIGDRLARREDLEWAQGPGVPQTVFDYMTQLMPVLAHPSGQEIMADWFGRNDTSRARWGRWFTLASEVWALFLEDGFLAAPWASGVLVNEPDLSRVWNRPLVIDLGADLTQVEADLLLVLGDYLDVLVLKPEPEWRAEYARTLTAYDVLEAKAGARKEPPLAAEPGARAATSYRKYTTMIAEVKDATAQVRRWLDAGTVQPRDIAIVAPDIEPYWFALSNYLAVEGIPVQKDRVRRLHSFPDVAQWLAHLRLKTGGHDEADLELALYAGPTGDSRLISFDKFKTLYSAVYGREDLERETSVARAFAVELDPEDLAGRDEFIAWSLKQLPAAFDADRIEAGLKRVLSECPESLSLPLKRWMTYLEQVLLRVEIRIAMGEADGLSCIRLSSAENSPAKKMIVLGLTEAALKKTAATSILAPDLWSLEREFGFHLASEDQAQLEFETRWLIEAGERELILSVPETDFNGAAQAPSWLWVKGSRESGEPVGVTVPATTRWDEIQKGELTAVARERQWSEIEKAIVENAIEEDFGRREIAAYADHFVTALSPSRIEDYLNCPFIFAAKHLFKLGSDNELDLEVDPLRRGSLMHAIFEILTAEPMRFDLDDEELAAIVDRARDEAKLILADERLWAPLRARHIDLARRFLKFEKEYRDRFAHVRTIERELDVVGHLRPSTGELIREPEPGSLEFKGRVDRIDQDDAGRLALFDYKSSKASASQHGSWLKDNRIQLLLYALAIENGLTQLDARPVLAALYYVARPFSRTNGFLVDGVEQNLYEIKDKRTKNHLSAEGKTALFREGQALVQKAVEGILSGRFAAAPRDPAQCKTCEWSSLCRTPHLNS